MFRTKLFARIIVYQAGKRLAGTDVLQDTGAGNILDLSSRHVLSNAVMSESHDRAKTASGGSVVTNKNFVAEIPLIKDDEARLANLMQRLGCDVGFIALGLADTTHLRWAEPSSLDIVDRSEGPLQFAPKVLRIESNVYHPDISHSVNLLEEVPFEGTRASPKVERSVSQIAHAKGTDRLYGLQTDDNIIYEWDPFTSGSVSEPRRVTTYVGELYYMAVDSDSHLILADNSSVYRVRISDGNRTKLFDEVDGLIMQGIGRITPGTYDGFVYWAPGTSKIYEVARDGTKQQSWSIADFTQINSIAYVDTGSSGGREVLVAATNDTVYRYLLEDGVDNIITTKAYSISNIISATSTSSSTRFRALKEREVNGELRSKEVIRYGSNDGTEIERTPLEKYVLRQRAVGERKGYEGPRYDAPNRNVSVDIAGTINNLGDGEQIVTELVFPVPFSTVSFDNIIGKVEAYNWSGTKIGETGVTDDPMIVIDEDLVSTPGFERSIWSLLLRIENTNRNPRLLVEDPAPNSPTLGPRYGGYVDDCTDRIASPAWNPSAIQYEVEIASGDGTEGFGIEFRDIQSDTLSNISVDWGDGTIDEGSVVDHYYDQTGRFTITIFAADFEGVYTARFGIKDSDGNGSHYVDASTFDISTLSLYQIRFNSRRDKGGWKNDWPNNYQPDSVSDFYDVNNCNLSYAATGVPRDVNRFTQDGNNSQRGDVMDLPKNMQLVDVENWKQNDTITSGGPVGDKTKSVLNLRSRIKVDADSLGADTIGGDSEIGSIIKWNFGRKEFAAGKLEQIFKATRDIEVLTSDRFIGDTTDDLRGTGLIPDSITKLGLLFHNIGFPPDDWTWIDGDIDTISFYTISKGGKGRGKWFENGNPQMQNVWDGLYSQRGDFAGARIFIDHRSTDQGGYIYCTATTEQELWRIVGLDSEHPVNGGSPLIDYDLGGFGFNPLLTINIATRVSDTELVCDLSLDLTTSTTNPGSNNSSTYSHDGSGNVLARIIDGTTKKKIRIFDTGMQFRIKDGSTDKGLYEISDHTYDENNDELTITIKSSPSVTGASGTLQTGIVGTDLIHSFYFQTTE